MNVQAVLRRIDEFQRARAWLAFPFAVIKKAGDDRAGNLAALIAYYGFFSMFPLLLVLVSVLGLVLEGNPDLQRRVLDSALAQFPIIGTQIRRNLGSLGGSGVALAVGVVGALWGGLGVTQAAQTAMNDVWDVPMKQRPTFVEKRVRGVVLLLVFGALVLGSTFLSGLGTFRGELGVALRLIGLAGSLSLNLVLFMVAFRVLTDRPLSWGEVFPGAAVAAVLWALAQALGNFYVSRTLANATEVYGFFGLILGLLAWIYLGAQITLYCAEINVVRTLRLWPRSLVQPPLKDADEETLTRAAKVEERVPQQEVSVRFEEGSVATEPGPHSGEPEGSSAGQYRSPHAEPPNGGRSRSAFFRSVALGAAAALGIGAARRIRARRRE